MDPKPSQPQASDTSKQWTPLELAEMKTGRRLGPISRPVGFSSRRRFKPKRGTTCYHVMSRTTGGEFLFSDTEKEAFRRMMWRMAKFAGAEIYSYAVLGNHFHILVKIPEKSKWLRQFENKPGEDERAGEERLLTHLSTVYSKAFLKQLRHEIETFRERGMEAAVEALLEKFKRRFCDVSLFVKELKERFSRWYNKQHDRRGTLWMDRFKSILVDGQEALSTMAAYIDLNPVRAGLVDDPKDYRWSGYGEAMEGSRRARRGLCKALGLPMNQWEARGLARYRLHLYDEGVAIEQTRSSHKSGINQQKKGLTPEARAEVIAQKGELPPPDLTKLLRERQESFGSGIAIGSREFIREMAAAHRKQFERTREHPGKVVDQRRGIHVLK